MGLMALLFFPVCDRVNGPGIRGLGMVMGGGDLHHRACSGSASKFGVTSMG